jgi:hypothetical protein
MKTYKHKTNGSTMTYKDGCMRIENLVIEGYPSLEFWEEVVEKDFEVITYADEKGNVWVEGYCMASLRGDGKKHIMNVKRLTDGEIFNIADAAKTITSRGNQKIDSFEIKQQLISRDKETGDWIYDGVDRVWVNWDGDSGGNWLDKIEHYKPIFKTEDGVSIYTDTPHYPVELNRYKLHLNAHGKMYSNGDKKRFKIFSTRELAEEYILMNKPCLSIKECVEISGKPRVSSLKEKLLEYVKSKLQ